MRTGPYATFAFPDLVRHYDATQEPAVLEAIVDRYCEEDHEERFQAYDETIEESPFSREIFGAIHTRGYGCAGSAESTT